MAPPLRSLRQDRLGWKSDRNSRKAKYLGGVGTKVTGITRRKFQPNLQTIKVELPSGQHKTLKVCTQCIRCGVVRKGRQAKAFQLPTAAKA